MAKKKMDFRLLGQIGSRQAGILTELFQTKYRCLHSSELLDTRGRFGGDLPSIKGLVDRGIVKKIDKYQTDLDQFLTKAERSRLDRRIKANPRAYSFYLIPDKMVKKIKESQ